MLPHPHRLPLTPTTQSLLVGMTTRSWAQVGVQSVSQPLFPTRKARPWGRAVAAAAVAGFETGGGTHHGWLTRHIAIPRVRPFAARCPCPQPSRVHMKSHTLSAFSRRGGGECKR
eukprot:352152-Chlamydomonas_euryale.AAC.6